MAGLDSLRRKMGMSWVWSANTVGDGVDDDDLIVLGVAAVVVVVDAVMVDVNK